MCIESERETLLKLKHHLIDSSNRLSSWNASVHSNCCQWDGIVCNNITSHVAELHLHTPVPSFSFDESLLEDVYDEAYEEYSRSRFGGEINPCLVDLKHLSYLDLSGNLFQYIPIPSFIATITSLTHLDLSDCGFMGTIPPQIGNLSNLLYLDLSYLDFGTHETLFTKNVHWLSSLSKLCYLDLGNTWSLGEGTPIPSFLGSMTTLIHLDLSNSGFMGNIPPHIGNLSNLAYLDLSYAVNGTISSQIGNLSNLLYLDLRSYYSFIGNDDWLSSLSKLEYLDLGGSNLSQSFQLLHTLQLLSSLKHLHLSECTLPRYNQPSFLNFSSLLTLDLSQISYPSTISFIPKWVFGLKKLVSLFLYNNYIEGPIPDSLRNLTLLENLDLNENSLSSSIPHWLGVLSHLKFLDLSRNNLQGNIPDVLGNVTSLVKFDLSYNELSGNLTLDYYVNKVDGENPKSLGKHSSLKVLTLSSNQLGGNPFESIGSLSKLLYLDIDDNRFQGVVNESHLENLICLRRFHASGNKLTLKVHRNWHPTFQLTSLDMSYWQLGPHFPLWTHSQNELQYLKMFNTGILDYIPHYFWKACYSLEYLNLSNNHIHGKIRNSMSNPISFVVVDLSSNHLHGKLPFFSSHVKWLDLSGNSFSSMYDFLCYKQIKTFDLNLLNLASNNLSGEIPDCWIQWPELIIVNLQSNHFVENMPLSMGSLVWLESLNIGNNSLSGTFPTALKKNNNLISLDIGENNLSGSIPTWIGEKLPRIKILRLRSNNFSGHIPNCICDMIFLQDFDLAQNSLCGNIPKCFNHFSAMLQKNKSTDLIIHTQNISSQAISISIWIKGKSYLYNSILGLVTNVDLSNNKLSGEIPREITYLDGLIYLNLSKNQLSGQIPPSIGNMRLLESIDLSRNQLSGEIPLTISNLSFLSNLDLSHNHLEGKIPTGTQIQSFEASHFIGNDLCGPPLPINCSSNKQISYIERSERENGGHGVNWFFVSFTLGFIVGFWIIIAPLLIYRSWRYAYFCFLDNIWYKVHHIGPIPDGLRNLTLLENLDLYKNSFSYFIPNWLFGVLSHLKFLDLSYNNLQGVIPDALRNLTSLVELDLSNNKLEGIFPTCLGKVTSLVKLDLSFNKLKGPIPTSLGKVASLVNLDVSLNKFEGPIPTSLGKVTSLVTLDLSYNQLSGNLTLDYYGSNVDGEHPKSLGKLSSLRVIRLSSNQLGGNPFKSLGSLSKLLYLDMDDNHFQGVVDESHLENLTSLKEFYASGNKLTLNVGRHWNPTFKLTHLDMSSWQLGILDYIPHYFWEIKKFDLENLYLSSVGSANFSLLSARIG
ncbi:hypothetical protein V8G54_012593 [Vigna mungo]|uniref:Leucine-rich repeat-containing N-terminal plant-type domain-containing protein n=1 Tax=Vigna mungo TaxID=3915 RepID=A0AAQ3NTY9_VIGMU